MIKRMSFGSLKASFSRRTRRRPRSTISSSDGGVQPAAARAVVANGVMVGTGVGENKDQVGEVGTSDTDTKQRSSATKPKHKGKKNGSRGGIWKTLRHKLSRNHRQCWDAGGSNTELDVDVNDGEFVTTGSSDCSHPQTQYRNNKQPKPSSVCPMQSGMQPSHFGAAHPLVRPASGSPEEGVYDEPTFPNGSMNLPNGVSGAGAAVGADGAKWSSSGGSKAKSRTGECCQPAGSNGGKRGYVNPDVVSRSSNNVVVVGDNNGVGVVSVCDVGSSTMSTPAHECSNAAAVVMRLNNSLSLATSMSSFNSQVLGSPNMMLDYRFVDGVGGGSHGDSNSTPKIRSLTRELFKLSKYGWYWGPITRTEAEEKLMDQPDGAFLVRDSSDDRHLLSLSFRSYGKTLHTRIEHCNGLFSFYAQPEPEGHTSIVDLIEHSMNYSQSGAFCYSRARSPGSPSFPVRLTKPVSRFTQVRTLQYLCRFIIRQYTRFDHIQELPLPSRIKGYIEEGHY